MTWVALGREARAAGIHRCIVLTDREQRLRGVSLSV